MLKELRSYGLTDISFLVVNSKDPLSQMLKQMLQKRVSFPVYQETPEEKVWSVLEGGKDDIFVYDRCGHLTYHIPYPLSIIHDEQPVVKAAIFSTYFQNLCGSSCSSYSPPNYKSDAEESAPTTTTSYNSTLEYQTEYYNFKNFSEPTEQNKTEIDADYYGNFTLEDDMNITLTNENKKISNNSNITSSNRNETSTNDNIFTILFNYFWKSESNDIPASQRRTNLTDSPYSNEANDKKEKSNPCPGIEENVCLQWNKRKLLHAKKCCEAYKNLFNGDQPINSDKVCRNFGRKRCKKIQTVLKCCLKSGLDPDSESNIFKNKDST